MWVRNVGWAQLSGSSSLGWAHRSVVGYQVSWRLAASKMVYLCAVETVVLQKAEREEGPKTS